MTAAVTTPKYTLATSGYPGSLNLHTPVRCGRVCTRAREYASPVHWRDEHRGGSPDSAQRGCEGRDVGRVVGDLERDRGGGGRGERGCGEGAQVRSWTAV